MSKYKVLKDNIKNVVAQEFEKTIPIITEEYEAKIRRQAAEITRLLAENEKLKEESKRNYTMWEKAKEEIKVGDIVRGKSDIPAEFCVTEISSYGRLYGIGRNGATYSGKNPEHWEKTGRHIDIDGFLKQIGGE